MGVCVNQKKGAGTNRSDCRQQQVSALEQSQRTHTSDSIGKAKIQDRADIWKTDEPEEIRPKKKKACV